MKFAHHHHRRGGVSVGHTRVARNDIESTPLVRVGCFDDDGGGGGVRTEITATTTTTTTTRIVIINNRTTVSTKAAAVLHGDRLGRCAYNWLVPGVASLRPWQARCVVYPSPRAPLAGFSEVRSSPVHGGCPRLWFFFLLFLSAPPCCCFPPPPCHDGSAWSAHGQVVVVMNIVILYIQGVSNLFRQSHTFI